MVCVAIVFFSYVLKARYIMISILGEHSSLSFVLRNRESRKDLKDEPIRFVDR